MTEKQDDPRLPTDEETITRAIEAYLTAFKQAHRKPVAEQILIAIQRLGWLPPHTIDEIQEAQLAKTMGRFWQALKDSRTGKDTALVEIDLSEKELELFSAIENNGRVKDHQATPAEGLLLTPDAIQKAGLFTRDEILAITEEAAAFAQHNFDVPEAYQLRYRELARVLSGQKIAKAQLAKVQQARLVDCPECKGEGYVQKEYGGRWAEEEIYSLKLPCTECKGTRKVQQARLVDCPECNWGTAMKGFVYGKPENYHTITVCPNCTGTAKAQQARPEREKIAEYFHTHWYLEHAEVISHYKSLSKEGKDFYRKMADQIRDLCPASEDNRGKFEERARIIQSIDEYCIREIGHAETMRATLTQRKAKAIYIHNEEATISTLERVRQAFTNK